MFGKQISLCHFILHEFLCPWLPVFSLSTDAAFSHLTLIGWLPRPYCLLFWALVLYLIQWENLHHKLTHEVLIILPQSISFCGFLYVFQLHHSLFFSQGMRPWNNHQSIPFPSPSITGKQLKAYLQSFSRVTKAQCILSVPSAITTECFLITLDQVSTFVRSLVTNPITMSLAASFELMLCLDSLFGYWTHPLSACRSFYSSSHTQLVRSWTQPLVTHLSKRDLTPFITWLLY